MTPAPRITGTAMARRLKEEVSIGYVVLCRGQGRPRLLNNLTLHSRRRPRRRQKFLNRRLHGFHGFQCHSRKGFSPRRESGCHSGRDPESRLFLFLLECQMVLVTCHDWLTRCVTPSLIYLTADVRVSDTYPFRSLIVCSLVFQSAFSFFQNQGELLS